MDAAATSVMTAVVGVRVMSERGSSSGRRVRVSGLASVGAAHERAEARRVGDVGYEVAERC